MTQYGFAVDLDLCAGCKACAMACKDKNDLPIGTKYRKVYDFAGGDWVQDENGAWSNAGVFSYSVSVACNHCANPACVAECPTGAMQKDPETGIVWSDPEVCIGCGTCVNTCPYGEPRLIDAADGKRSGKCDMCRDLVEQGQNPRCVDACIMRCLHFGDIDELRAAYGANADVEPLPSSAATSPSLVIVRNAWNSDGSLPGAIVSSADEIM